MKRVLPSLTALRSFECAARHESFSRAAEELCVTHGAVSRQVAALEDDLGCQLFERRHGMVRLTTRGCQLRDELSVSFLRIHEATERVRARFAAGGSLRVNAPPAFSVRWLIPRLATLQRRYPSIHVALTSSVAPPDFGADEYDLAIRRCDSRPCGVYAVKLFDEMSIPVCHVDIAPKTAFKDPVEWLTGGRVSLVRVAAEPRGWEKWAREWHVDLSRTRFIDVELTYLAVQAALEGLGVVLLPLALVTDDIARGLLAAPIGALQVDASAYYVMSAKRPPKRSAASRAIEWLENEGRQSTRVAADAMGGVNRLPGLQVEDQLLR